MSQLTKSKVYTILEEMCNVVSSDKLLVAVSGGADSMALLDILNKLGFELAAAHCNFNLRGEESDRDEQLVLHFCREHEIELLTTSFATEEYAKNRKVSIEMAARQLRYEWFSELLNKYGFSSIVTGHHGNDSIETFFLNLVRGTGVKGLTGISFRNGNVVRPLLGFKRSELEAYCKKEEISFCHDASNDDTKFIRNKIRHEVIPVLESINPAFFDTMLANMAHLMDAELMLEVEVKRFMKDEVVDEHGKMIIPISKLENYPHHQSLLFEVLRPYGFNTTVVKEVSTHLHGLSGKQFFSATHRLIKDRHNLLVMPIEEIQVPHFWVEEGFNNVELPMDISIYSKPEDFQFSRDPQRIHLDAELLDLPLLVRKWQKGDSFMPLGMKGFKKLSDFFIDKKYSLKDKEDAWLVISGEDVIWLAGCRIDDRFKVTKRTKRILEIELK
ncbi:tRNA lysidine(34) synthetase TilS [Carboxylicivirga sp. M1479]|uniref:tRNA lysidine(34) synthetase TilS n=1 Tax=Carboxylicivirga sp. M1479 TaxID=2594476 RepID=UPI001178B6FD|nr:tRNA lysidine(34) synthetase TilS [Carboxylicivirga sp. M1479]TRX71930.1 tRNA lysidine(34) synthetase TilS [Carboxylicivirga sp. M1479]